MYAASADDILERYPELYVFTPSTRPDWMTEGDYESYGSNETVDVDAPPTGWLREVMEGRMDPPYWVRFVGGPNEGSRNPHQVDRIPTWVTIERWLDGEDDDFEDDEGPLPEGERVIHFERSRQATNESDGRAVWTYTYSENFPA